MHGNETWHTDSVHKPRVQHLINITPVPFNAPRNSGVTYSLNLAHLLCNRGVLFKKRLHATRAHGDRRISMKFNILLI